MSAAQPKQCDFTQAANLIHHGGIIAYPTEAVFGLGCDPRDPTAIQRLIALKQRPRDKGLILIAASIEQVQPWIKTIDAPHWQQVLATWPGPVTWVFPASDSVLSILRGVHNTIAIRVTAHPIAAQLCQRVGGAIVSTSANISGQAAARSVSEVCAQFPAGVDGVVAGEVDRTARPSEIRDALTGAVLRTG